MKKKAKVFTIEDAKRLRESYLKRNKLNPTPKARKSGDGNPSLNDFIRRHKLDREMLFDARGRQIVNIENEMKQIGAQFAFNCVPCYKGHTYRDRNNHCIICNSAYIAFQLRHSSDGFIYIAGSLKHKLIKIGVSKSIKIREESLNKDSYGGVQDWKILYSFYTNNCGLIENQAHQVLEKHRTSIPDVKDNRHKMTSETFFCSFKKAYSALKEIIQRNNILVTNQFIKVEYISMYDFRNLTKL